jgi:ABC-type nitrate/sulfonate/bicarbonate transport system permease component
MVVWFGINETFVVASVVAASSVSLMFSTYAGVREVGLRYYELATALQITRHHLFFKVLLPGSVPFISSGLKLAFEQSIAAVVVAEFLVGVPGIGFIMRSSRAELDAASLFALAIALMVFGMICVGFTTLLERRFSTWRPAS